MLEERAVEGGRYNYSRFMIDKHMVQRCFLLCNNYAQPCVVFDAVMQSSFSLCHALVPVFYFGGGVLLTLSPDLSWSAVCFVVVCMCSLLSSASFPFCMMYKVQHLC